MKNEQADIVLHMPSGLEFTINFASEGVIVAGQSDQMATAIKRIAEESRSEVGPQDGDPHHATASILAERLGAKIISVVAIPTSESSDGQEIVY